MDMFQNIASVEQPGRDELKLFVKGVIEFLAKSVEDEDFDFLWQGDTRLKRLATATFVGDVVDYSMPALIQAIPDISQSNIQSHGLEGRPLRFKLVALNSIVSQFSGRRYQTGGGGVTSAPIPSVGWTRAWFQRAAAAIDAILDSLIQAAGGTGGLIKEFKDMLAALAGE